MCVFMYSYKLVTLRNVPRLFHCGVIVDGENVSFSAGAFVHLEFTDGHKNIINGGLLLSVLKVEK